MGLKNTDDDDGDDIDEPWVWVFNPATFNDYNIFYSTNSIAHNSGRLEF